MENVINIIQSIPRLRQRFGEYFGDESQQKLLFVPDADNEPDVDHEISEPAIFRFLINEEYLKQLDEAEVEIPEMLKVLKDIDKQSKITEFETHQSSMGLATDWKEAFHVFIVFKTTSKNDDGDYWWSLEKNQDYIVLQRSRNKDNVKDKCRGDPRNKVKSIKEDLKGKGTIKDLFALLWVQQVIAEKYHIKKSNCQSFVTFISKGITEEEYEYKGYFKYSPPPENDRDKKMLEFSINLLDSGVNEWHPLFYLILLGDTDLVDKFIKSGQYDINAFYKGLNPLHFAITFSKTKMVQHLLSDPINFDPTRRDKKGMNALHWAGMYAEKTEIFDLLLAHDKVNVDDVDELGRTALYLAAYACNVIAVQKLLEKGANPNIVDNEGRSPLQLTAQERDDYKILDLLVVHGKVKIDHADGNGHTALHLAAFVSNDIAVQKLLEKGANPNIADNEGWSPLHMASNEITAEHLIKKGAELHCRANDGSTPLHHAAFFGKDMQIIDFLLRNINEGEIEQYKNDEELIHHAKGNHYGLGGEIRDRFLKKGIITDERTRRFEENVADPLMDLMTFYGRRIERAKNWQDIDEILKEEHLDINGRDQKGQTLLFVAVCANNVTGVRLLLERGADPTIRNNNGLTPLHFAAHYAITIETISLILENKQVDINHRDKDGMTALHFAIDAENLTTARYLLENGADPTIRNNKGYTPFHLATRYKKDFDILNVVLESGKVDINESMTPKGATALHLAIIGSNVDSARFLLSKGANPNLADEGGLTPLFMAALLAKDSMDTLELLVNHQGVDVNLMDNKGRNALHYAKLNENGLGERIANLLKKKGVVETENEQRTINKGMNNMHSRIFSNKKADEVINFFSDDNTIPIEAKIDTISEEHLLSAITDSNFEFVRNLLKNGVDMNARGEKGENALHVASRYAKTTDLIDIILEKGKFDINSVDIDGRTCLHHAIMGSYSTNNVPHLLQKGADPSIADKDDHSPLHFAASRAKEIETISLILGNKQVDINHINIGGATALHKAIGAKNVEIARCLLENGADPTIGEQTGYTPFHLAAQFLTDTDVLSLMLANEKKIDIDERNKQGGTALYLATCASNFDAARFLLAKGANPNVADVNGLTPLHLAARNAKDMNMFKLFVNHKDANINHLDKNGNNALQYAKYNQHGLGKAIANLLRGKGAAKAEIIYHHEPESMAGAGRIKQDSDMETIRFLIENGLDMCVMTGGEIGANAFHVVSAANEKMTEPISFILDPDLYAEPTAPNCSSADDNNENMAKKVLEEAIRNSDPEKVRNLKEMGADLGKTTWRKGMNALHEVSFYAKTTDLIDVVLETGEFDIDGTENEGFTPLHHAISGINREKNARYLLEKGADPTIADKKGNTPFHFAAQFLTDIHVLGIMLANEKKIDIDEKDKKGRTALHMAIVESNVNVARFLLSNGANPNVADKNGSTPLQYAVMFAKDMDMVKLFLDHEEVDDNYLDNKGNNALHCAKYNQHGLGEKIANLLREKRAVKAEGISHEPKNIAASVPGGIEEDSDIKTVRLLIESGQDISAMTWGENGANALHLAAAGEKTTDLIDAILMETGKFDINAVDNYGWTPLHYAIKGPKPITINARRLIKMGADPGIANKNGVTPLHMAARNAETMDLIELLLNTEKLNVNDYDHNGLTALAYAGSNKHGIGQRIIDRLEEYDMMKRNDVVQQQEHWP